MQLQQKWKLQHPLDIREEDASSCTLCCLTASPLVSKQIVQMLLSGSFQLPWCWPVHQLVRWHQAFQLLESSASILRGGVGCVEPCPALPWPGLAWPIDTASTVLLQCGQPAHRASTCIALCSLLCCKIKSRQVALQHAAQYAVRQSV